MVQLHCIGASRHWRRRVGSGRASISPELVATVVPVNDDREARRHTSRRTLDIPTLSGDRHVIVEIEAIEESDVGRARGGNTTASHGKNIRAMETCSVVFSWNMAGVHYNIKG